MVILDIYKNQRAIISIIIFVRQLDHLDVFMSYHIYNYIRALT